MKAVFLIVWILFASAVFADVGMLTKVVDGDTAYFGNVKCRFSYIDTPESKHNEKVIKDSSKCPGMTPDRMVDAGKLSAQYTMSKLQLGKTYKYTVIDTDRYGRSVCDIEANGESLNLSVVSNGYAVPFNRYINDEYVKRLYAKNEAEAKRKGRGLWGSHRNVMECMDGE